jgi:hypothetical protein
VCYLVKLSKNEIMNVWFSFDYPHVHVSLNVLQDSLNLKMKNNKYFYVLYLSSS